MANRLVGRVFTTIELARIFEKDPETIRRWARAGVLHGTYASKREGFLFSEADVVGLCDFNPQYMAKWNAYVEGLEKGTTVKTLNDKITEDDIRRIVREELIRLLNDGLGS